MRYLFNKIRVSVLSSPALRNSILINITYIIYSLAKRYISIGFKCSSITSLIDKKNSDTLVILGAGSSINELSQNQIDKLHGYDVAGLSYSCVLPFRQKYYFYECPQSIDFRLVEEHVEKLIPLIASRYREGQIENMIWKNSRKNSVEEHLNFANYSAPIFCSFLADDAHKIQFIFNLHRKLKLCKYFLLQKRGSVTGLLQFGLCCGYSSIIFVGVDLNSSNYFFEESDKYAQYNFSNPFELENEVTTSDVHRTNDPVWGQPISEIIRAMTIESEEVKFSVSSKNSVLSEFLPLWE